MGGNYTFNKDNEVIFSFYFFYDVISIVDRQVHTFTSDSTNNLPPG